MKHLGDITKINGAEIEPVDCICGGSPCQDLSMAGLRKGLAGERSGLYMEQIRIVKEMRENDRANGRSGMSVRPRWMVWENVPGAFSSNKGADFAAVLTEAFRVIDPDAPDVPVPAKGWPKAGCLYDELGRGSIAWRITDAQYWGVAQRRKRICMVCDFNGMQAAEVLFDPQYRREAAGGEPGAAIRSAGEECGRAVQPVGESLPGNPDESGTAWERTAGNLEDGSGTANSYTLQIRGGCEGGGKGALIQAEKSATLATHQTQTLFQAVVLNDQGGSSIGVEDGGISPTLRAESHQHEPVVAYGISSFNSNAMRSNNKNRGIVVNNPCFCMDVGLFNALDNQAPTSLARQYKDPPIVVYDARGNGDGKTVPTITGDHENRVTDYTALAIEKIVRWIVRRLTPLECERLQGYPDGWTDIGDWVDSKGKTHKASDSPRYKALGNSIAVGYANSQSGFWCWLLKRISGTYERTATMGSLFDGIGGFPLAWEAVNGKGSARWASEIEEFPIAVTKLRFPDEEDGKHENWID